MKKIAFCTDAAIFNENKILDEDLARKYPGSLWVQRLFCLADTHQVELVTGDIAVQKVHDGKWNAKDILVIQEDCAAHAQQLIELGAIPFLVLSLESPLYASKFYGNLAEIVSKFENRLLFRGSLSDEVKPGVNHVVYFPCFSIEEKKDDSILPWTSRKYMVMVAANKYWTIKRRYFRKLLAATRDFLYGRKSFLSTEVINSQLHDKRLELIEYFGGNGDLALFGMYWDDIDNLPDNWKMRLSEIVKKMNPPSCQNKNKTIAQYKFALCLENMTALGYVTEKIIDCFYAGVIPVYCGAPDIVDFVPKQAFVHLADFASYDDLNTYLKNLTEEDALKIMTAGRAFLDSAAGKRHSFEGFAGSVMDMAQKHLAA